MMAETNQSCTCSQRDATPRRMGHAVNTVNSVQKGTMPFRCCRVLYRARSRSQRRRVLLWTVSLALVVTVMYYNQQTLQQLSYLSHDSVNDDFQAQPDGMVGRHPRAVNQERLEDLPPQPMKEEQSDVKAEEDDDKSDLRSGLAPATLHFLWCGKRHFEFRHYMAVKRADRLVRPDKIFFHYEALPVMDQEGYFLWFNRTLADVDNVLLRPLSNSTCALQGADRFLLVLDILERFGGTYVPEDSLLVDFPVHLRSSALVTGVQANSPEDFQDGLMAAMKGAFKKPSTREELLVTLSLQSNDHGGIQPCGSIEHYNNEDDGDCICVKVTTSLYPADILEANTPFATLARVAAYGRSQWQLEHSMNNPIPRIAHYICIDCQIRFLAFLSMRSCVNVAGLNKVYLHGVKEPQGKWWDKLKQDSRFVYVPREYPETIYDHTKLTPQLAVGIMRVSILLKYGGVYCDDKVLWTQRIPDNHFGYSAVASPDWHLYGSWPESVNHGVMMAKKNAPYLLKLRGVLHKYRHNQYWFNDHFMAYKIVESHPELLYLDRHLQVKCLNHNCHPTWQENYKSGLMQNKPGSAFSWQNETMSVHWTDTFPELDLDMVKYTSGMVVEVARSILMASGIVIQDMR